MHSNSYPRVTYNSDDKYATNFDHHFDRLPLHCRTDWAAGITIFSDWKSEHVETVQHVRKSAAVLSFTGLREERGFRTKWSQNSSSFIEQVFIGHYSLCIHVLFASDGADQQKFTCPLHYYISWHMNHVWPEQRKHMRSPTLDWEIVNRNCSL